MAAEIQPVFSLCLTVIAGITNLGRMNTAELKANAQLASTLLKAMSNERRLLILCSLAEGELSVGQLERLVDLSQSALSQHLARLRHDGLVETRRDAQTIYYSLKGDEARTVIQTLHDLYCRPEAAVKARSTAG